MASVSIEQAVTLLRQGEVIAYPTEAVFGVGCDPFNEAAVTRLLQLKQRPIEKGMILAAASVAQIEPLIQTDYLTEQIIEKWPGPITWVLPVSDRVPTWVTGRFDSVAVRVSSHPTLQALCRQFGGPIISTSANLSGQPPAKSCQEIAQLWGESFPCIAQPLGHLTQPTPIWDARSLKQLR